MISLDAKVYSFDMLTELSVGSSGATLDAGILVCIYHFN